MAVSITLTDVLRRLGLRAAGGNFAVLKKWISRWEISTDHFDPGLVRGQAGRAKARPLGSVLVERSTYPRDKLKRRLYESGLKARTCELCGQDEEWRGRSMALILDHVNGVADDNRLDNLRIVCPNCAATLDTHCARNLALAPRRCEVCAHVYKPRTRDQRYCSAACSATGRGDRLRGVPYPERRQVKRPPYDVLMTEIATTSYLAVGRRYGVSDNAVRKWVRQYERERAAAAAGPPGAATLPA